MARYKLEVTTYLNFEVEAATPVAAKRKARLALREIDDTVLTQWHFKGVKIRIFQEGDGVTPPSIEVLGEIDHEGQYIEETP